MAAMAGNLSKLLSGKTKGLDGSRAGLIPTNLPLTAGCQSFSAL